MNRFMQNQMRLLAAAGEGGEGGGGGGDGKGSSETGVTKEMQDFVTKTVNSAVTSHLKRFEAKTLDSFGSLKGEIAAMLEEKLKAAKQDDDEAESGKGSKGGELPPEVQKLLARQTAEIEKLRKQTDDERRAREEMELRTRRNEERQHLTAALRASGVSEPMIRTLVPYLHSEAGKVKRGDDGSIVFVHDDEEHPLEKGVAAWLKTEDGKAYLPPVDAGGSGNRGGAPPARKPGQPMSDREAAAIIGQALMSGALNGGGGLG